MYITITPQKIGGNFAQSVADYVAYLDKENQGKQMEDMEHFFNQYGEGISQREVIHDIDRNTAKLRKSEPKFYTITVNPSQRELKQLKAGAKDLKTYTRELMKDYAKAFNREIEGKSVTVDDIKYYAKIEHERTFKGTDRVIRENAPYHGRILTLEHEIQQIQSGKIQGDIVAKRQEIKQLVKEAPNKVDGHLVKQGMKKEGLQAHIHIIVSRKDKSNRYSLSPGSKYKASEVEMNGKTIKRGFDRDRFFKDAEKTFDTLFNYKRNYVETYTAKKTFVKNTQAYYAAILGLPTSERAVAFKLLGKTGVNTTIATLPTNKVQLVLKAIKQIKRGVGKAMESGSIGI
tara:strand:- start:3120 stop:4154 length:1035 start_codon:yes stop_codon:yes gene_type:complete